jgi:hypothetical protein
MQADGNVQNGRAAAMAPRYLAGPREVATCAAPPELLDGLALIAPLVRLGARLRAADQRRPWIADAALVLAVAALFCLPDLLGRDSGPRAVTMTPRSVGTTEILLLQAGLVLPLLCRRRAPATVFALVTAVFIVQWSAGVWLPADAATLIALYSLVRHARLRYLWACYATSRRPRNSAPSRESRTSTNSAPAPEQPGPASPTVCTATCGASIAVCN